MDAIDAALYIARAVLELVAGPQTLDAMRSFREGRLTSPLPITVAIDAASVFEAIVANLVKVPAEKSLFVHLLWVRELLSRGQLRGWSWIDTRDMIADGLTKGSVERAA